MRRVFFALIAVFLAGPALATQDAWPALFDVRGVAADDVLNIRAEPSASSPIVGGFTHDAKNVEVMRTNDAGTWGQVNTLEGRGWVSLAFLERLPGQWDGAFPEVAACYGTEPFWAMSRRDGLIEWFLPGIAPSEFRESWQTGTPSHHGKFAFAAQGTDRSMTAVVTKEMCGDGMSDRLYGLTVSIVMDKPGAPMLLTGCCSLVP